jgi:hypothetical protein
MRGVAVFAGLDSRLGNRAPSEGATRTMLLCPFPVERSAPNAPVRAVVGLKAPLGESCILPQHEGPQRPGGFWTSSKTRGEHAGEQTASHRSWRHNASVALRSFARFSAFWSRNLSPSRYAFWRQLWPHHFRFGRLNARSCPHCAQTVTRRIFSFIALSANATVWKEQGAARLSVGPALKK